MWLSNVMTGPGTATVQSFALDATFLRRRLVVLSRYVVCGVEGDSG
jgi:hypothetical protein